MPPFPTSIDSDSSQTFSLGSAPSLPPAELKKLQRLLTPKWSKYIPHKPHLKQSVFLLLDQHEEVLFGGAAGGGKSDALLMAALQYVDVPGYSALLSRRTFKQLSKPGALIPLSHEWLSGTDAAWNGDRMEWRFPGGAVLSFGHIEHENSVYDHQGAVYQFVGFDELTQYTQGMWDFLGTRVRRLEGSAVPIRRRASANPGGVGHDWVKAHFIDPGAPGLFVPSKLEDNPSLDRKRYRRSLRAVKDPVLRRQMEEGDWNVRARGPVFDRSWFEVLDVLPPAVLEKLKANRARFWDLAATAPKTPTDDPDWTAGALLAEADGVFYVLDMRRGRGKPLFVQELVKGAAARDGVTVPIRMEQEPGSSGVNTIDTYARTVLKGFNFMGERSTGNKAERAAAWAAAAQLGNLKLLRGPWVGDFLAEVEAFPYGAHDDQVDAVSGAFKMLADGGGWFLV